MLGLTAEEIAQRALDLELLDERSLQEVWSQLGSRSVSPEQFGQMLLRRDLLTNFQLDRVLKGERNGYFYGHYKVLYQVGAGTFARVYRAVNVQNGQIMAVKVLRKRFNETPEERSKFCKEGEVGITLRHPNIVPIYEVASDRRASYMVMDFIEGRNLREFMKIRKQLDPLEATRLMVDITSGLEYAFKRGISHRDLKMSNVLVSSVGQAKLLDFGLAGADGNLSDEALANLDNPRTIDYAALERASGARKDDNRSDIYFLGCIFYNLIAGQPPLTETRDRLQRLSKHRFLEVVPLLEAVPSVPLAVASVVGKAMQLDPEQRYQTPGEMLADLLTVKQAPGADPSAAAAEAATQATLMVVESGNSLQNVLRDTLKKSGYKVLLTADPRRPANWFNGSDRHPADCVLFSTAALGKAALEAFNQFGAEEATAQVPSILMLSPKHLAWRSHADVADHRLILEMPLKLRELREALGKLLPRGETDSVAT